MAFTTPVPASPVATALPASVVVVAEPASAVVVDGAPASVAAGAGAAGSWRFGLNQPRCLVSIGAVVVAGTGAGAGAGAGATPVCVPVAGVAGCLPSFM